MMMVIKLKIIRDQNIFLVTSHTGLYIQCIREVSDSEHKMPQKD